MMHEWLRQHPPRDALMASGLCDVRETLEAELAKLEKEMGGYLQELGYGA